MKPSKWRWFRRRSAIEPVIGHMKEDYRMDRNYRKGIDGDKMNAILAECGFNFQPGSTSRSHPTLCKARSVQIGQDGFQCDSGWSRSFHGLAACCPGLRIRCNDPYHGDADALLTAWRKKFSATYYLGIELEINQWHFLEKRPMPSCSEPMAEHARLFAVAATSAALAWDAAKDLLATKCAVNFFLLEGLFLR